MNQLTARQQEIVGLACEGLTDKQIARQLKLSVETVHGHWKAVRSRLNVSSRSEAIARLLNQANRAQLAALEQQRFDLSERLDAKSVGRRDYEAEIAQLAELTKRQAELLRTSMADAERRTAKALRRLDHLEALNDLTFQTKALLHKGEFGASWRKYFMSESAGDYGISCDQWMDGTKSFFDIILPQYVERNIPVILSAGGGTGRVLVTYEVDTGSGVRFMLDLLTCDEETGTYNGLTIDITEWAPQIEQLAKNGWLARLASAPA
jgi:DNA-binding CsgD family transcriptional regulator